MGWRDDQRLIDDLVAEYYDALYRYAYRLSGSAADAEDLTQDTFCKAQTQIGQLRDRTRSRAWLFSILRNSYLHQARAERTHKEVPLDHVGDLPGSTDDKMPFVDSELLQQALNELPESARTPIILFYFEDFSYRDIAEQMDLPLGTVMSRLARARAFLRERLLPGSDSAECRGRANDGL